MNPVAALIYDFDRTLSPKDMQEYAFIPEVGMTPSEFWKACGELENEHQMDPILAYMLFMIKAAKGNLELTKDVFFALGKSVQYFSGVETWFSRINEYGKKVGVDVEHYIVSSGLKEIIEGTVIAKEFKKIYAASYYYDENGIASWPAMAVNYTSKTQFIYRINKGVLDSSDHSALNEFMPDSKRRVPFSNMIYFGDGYTDVPSMKLVRVNGGHSVAVYSTDDSTAKDLLRHGRVDFLANADYSTGSKMENIVCSILDKIAIDTKINNTHFEDMEKSNECEEIK